jgi:hypothetical protein
MEVSFPADGAWHGTTRVVAHTYVTPLLSIG